MKKIILLILLLLPFFLFSQEKEKRLALVIGNANYDKGALKNPVNDARLIAKTLDSLDFEVILATDLNKDEFMNHLVKFGEMSTEYDLGFIYYAGHGVQISGVNYLLPINQVFDEEWKIEEYAINVNRVLKYLTKNTDDVNILILDACRNDPWKNNRSIEESNNGGLAKISAPARSLIGFSTKAGAVAADGDEENSIYCKSLVKNILTENTTLDQVFRNIRSDVLKDSKEMQITTEYNALTGEDIFLNPGNYNDEFLEIETILKDEFGNRYRALAILEPILKVDLNNFQGLLLKARIYTSLQDYEKANLEFEKIISLGYINSEIYYHRANYYKSLKEYDKQLKDLNKTIELEPANPNFYYDRGLFYLFQKKDYEKAITDFKSGLNLNPDNKDFYFQMAYSYEKLEQFDNAILTYSNLIELEPKFHEAYINIALIYKSIKNDYQNALKYYNKGIKNNTNTADIYINRATLLADNLNEYEKALRDYNRAIEINPKNSIAFYYRGFYYKKIGEYENAIKDFKKGLTLKPEEEEDFYFQLAYCYEALGIYDKSIQNYSELIKLDSLNHKVYNNLAHIYTEYIKDYNKALGYFNKVIEINPDNGIYFLNRATLLADNLNEYDKALRDYNRAIELEPANPDFYYDRGRFYEFHKEDYKNAIKDFEKGLTLNPEHIGFYFQLAYSNGNLEQYDEAILNYLNLIKLDPENFYAYNNIGLIYAGRYDWFEKDYKKALKYFNKGIEVSPDNSIIFLNRAELYAYNLKDYEKASKDFNTALKLDPDSNSINNSFLNFNFFQKKYETVIKLNDEAIIRDSKDPTADYLSALIHIKQKNDFKALISLSHALSKIKHFSKEGYYIIDYNNKALDFSKVFILRSELYEKFGEYVLMCEDLNDAQNFAEDEALKKEIQKSILEKCNK